MGKQRLCNLSIISIEHEFIKTLNIDNIITEFAKKTLEDQTVFCSKSINT